MKKKHRKPLDKNSHSSFSSIKIPMFFRMKFIQSFHHFPMDFPIIFLWISAKSELPRRCEPWADSSGAPWRNPWPPVMFGKSMGKIWDQMGKWWENDGKMMKWLDFFPLFPSSFPLEGLESLWHYHGHTVHGNILTESQEHDIKVVKTSNRYGKL